ncbi:MAG: FtsX-like permease family protein, partial [Blautia wexlerae]
NEIMLPTWALRAMGVDDPQIGMIISLSYQLGTDYQYSSDEFVLSGYYTDYSASRAGNRGAAYVSELFATQTGLPFDSVSTAMISFSDDSNALRSCEKLKRKISFTESQSFEIVPIAQSNSTTIVLPLAAIIVFIIISGYLLIYNILYISISRDTQFYGQLKTIGTTKRQIKRIVRSQIFRTAVIGIPSGLIVGGIVSLGLVPFAMNMMYSSDTDLGEIVSFSPIIFAGAAIFTFFTAIIGSMKPAKIAASISPVAASRYTEANTRSYRDHKSHRTKLSRMARDNIFRNPKSAFLTFASLFLGLILFLVSAGLLSSLSPDNFVNQWGESDFALTYSISEEGNLLSDEMLQQIETMQGIENLRVTYSASPWPTMDVIYDENVFGKYIDSLDGVSGLDFSNAETRKNYTDNFWSGVYGIDSRYIEELNKTLDKPIDLTAFEKGELVVLSAMTDDEGNLLIQPGQAITVVGESGEQVFTVATGFLDADFQSGRGNERGTAPDLYISEQALEKLSGETKIFRIAFDTIDSSYDKGIMEQLQSITASSPGITILSRYEKQQEMAGYLLTSRIIAAGLSAVFLLIGIMNFINTMVVSVNTRKHEFATLESIGMTKKQIRNVLLWEGVYYWSISFLLLATLGTAIYIPIYSAFRRMVPYAA